MAQLKDLLVAGSSRLIGDTVLSAGATSEGSILPSENGTLNLGDSTHKWKINGGGTTSQFLRGDGTWQTALTSHQTLPNGSISGSPGAANTITSFSQSNGQVSASFSAIAIASSQITSGVVDLTAKGTIGWEGNSSTTTNKYLVDRNAIAYWNGAYSGTSSNLTYCTKGAFGDLAVINKPTSNTTTTFLRGDGTWQTALTSHQSLANYVTLNGAETISGAKTFSAVLKATNSNGVEAQKYQINDSSNANKAYWQYNSTDACVDLIFN